MQFNVHSCSGSLAESWLRRFPDWHAIEAHEFTQSEIENLFLILEGVVSERNQWRSLCLGLAGQKEVADEE